MISSKHWQSPLQEKTYLLMVSFTFPTYLLYDNYMDVSNLSGTKFVDLTLDAVLQWLICGAWVSLQSLHFQWDWEQFMNFILYAICFLSSQSWGCGITCSSVWSVLFIVLLSICYLFLFANMLWSFYVSMFVSISYLFLYTDVLWSFLCEYVCKYLLFISLYRCVVVLFMWVCV